MRWTLLLLLLTGCADSQWASVGLDTGFSVGLPMLGVETEAHCKLDLNKPGETNHAPPVAAPDPSVRAALAELHELGLQEESGIDRDQD